MTRRIRLCCQFTALFLLLSVLPPRLSASTDAPRPADLLLEPGGNMRWAVWNSRQYALADDGEAIWIGTTGRVVRFDKATRTHQRFTTLDGLPHAKVLAVAVDGQGNRWFGGDGGLTVLRANGRWQQFDITNSGLHYDLVDGIAVAADDTLWLSHGLPYGAVSRRNPDGTWDWFPNREAAVVGDFDRVLTTRNRNRLWTPVGGTMWVDWAEFDGAMWHDRTPPDVTTRAATLVADGQGRIWALVYFSYEWTYRAGRLFRWDDGSWRELRLCDDMWLGEITALDADDEGQIWIAGILQPFLYMRPISVVGRFGQDPLCDYWSLPSDRAIISVLLAQPTGAWGISNTAQIALPDASTVSFADQPGNPYITNVISESDDLTWTLSASTNPQRMPLSARLEAIDVHATAALADDTWLQAEAVHLTRLSAAERTPSGDLWIQGVVNGGKAGAWPTGPYLRHNGQWVDHYERPFCTSDIYAQNDRTIWFTAEDNSAAYPCNPTTILKLDDAGTPASQEDDIWTSYPTPPEVINPSITVDSLGRLWLGDANGLYRFDGTTWESVGNEYGGQFEVHDLAALPDGAVIVRECFANSLRVIRSGDVNWLPLDAFIRQNYALVRATRHINSMWSVAPDDGVWYVAEPFLGQGEKLYRYDGSERTSFGLPFPPSEITSLDVDRNNHIWVAAANNLWRLAPRPDFHVDAGSAGWLLAPGQRRARLAPIIRQEGFARPVSLQVTGLPEGITAEIQPNPVTTQEAARITLSVSPQTPPGEYTATLHAESVLITHETPLRIIIAADVHEHWLPLIAR